MHIFIFCCLSRSVMHYLIIVFARFLLYFHALSCMTVKQVIAFYVSFKWLKLPWPCKPWKGPRSGCYLKKFKHHKDDEQYSCYVSFQAKTDPHPKCSLDSPLVLDFKLILSRTHLTMSLSLQGSRVCAWEAFWKLAARRTWLGDFQEPILGHTNPSLGQRWLRGGQENTKHKHALVML